MPRISGTTGLPVPRNPFKNRLLRAEFEGAIFAYETKHKSLFLPNGERRTVGCYGSSFATYFWHGYDNVVRGRGWDPESKRLIAYALWCAGRAVRKREEKAIGPQTKNDQGH